MLKSLVVALIVLGSVRAVAADVCENVSPTETCRVQIIKCLEIPDEVLDEDSEAVQKDQDTPEISQNIPTQEYTDYNVNYAYSAGIVFAKMRCYKDGRKMERLPWQSI